MDSRQIENFLAVYEARSMRVAARQRYISEQGLSKSIRTLEAELGSALFERTRAGVVPTAAGRYFHEYAVDARDAATRMKADLGVLADGRRELRLPCSYGALHRAYGVLHRFEESRSEIHIHWLELDDVRSERMVEAGEAPFRLLVRSPEPKGLDFVPLYSCWQVLLVPDGHPLCQKGHIEYEDLEGVPLAFEGSDFHVNRLRGRKGCFRSSDAMLRLSPETFFWQMPKREMAVWTYARLEHSAERQVDQRLAMRNGMLLQARRRMPSRGRLGYRSKRAGRRGGRTRC